MDCGLALSVGISCDGGAESLAGDRAGRSCKSVALPEPACLSCCSSAGEIKPRLRLSHCGLEDVKRGEDMIGLEQPARRRWSKEGSSQ